MERKIGSVRQAAAPSRRSEIKANRMVVASEAFEAQTPFLVLVEDWFALPAGFPTHPHRGMQTVTFVLDGALEHRDHTGGFGVLREGDVQWMTAGRGVLHSELPFERETAHTLQLWLNLPAKLKMIPARYVNQLAAEVAVVNRDGSEVRVYAGKLGNVVQPHGSDWPMSLFDIRTKAGSKTELEVPAGDRGFLYVLEGSAQLGAGATEVKAGDVAWLEPDAADADRLTVTAQADFRALLYSSPPIDEPIVAYGPFVMNTEAEIQQAYEDYQANRLVS